MKRLLVLFALVAVAFAQKSVEAPQPSLIEMPSEQFAMPNAPAATIAETTHSTGHVSRPIIQVPHRHEVIDIPHSPLQLPSGGVQEGTALYDIPQPIVGVPKPIIQEKPVIFNVPQDIIQVPKPIIRHRPILYKVQPVVKLNKPIIKHNRVFYEVPEATLQKSGYGSNPRPFA